MRENCACVRSGKGRQLKSVESACVCGGIFFHICVLVSCKERKLRERKKERMNERERESERV